MEFLVKGFGGPLQFTGHLHLGEIFFSAFSAFDLVPSLQKRWYPCETFWQQCSYYQSPCTRSFMGFRSKRSGAPSQGLLGDPPNLPATSTWGFSSPYAFYWKIMLFRGFGLTPHPQTKWYEPHKFRRSAYTIWEHAKQVWGDSDLNWLGSLLKVLLVTPKLTAP